MSATQRTNPAAPSGRIDAAAGTSGSGTVTTPATTIAPVRPRIDTVNQSQRRLANGPARNARHAVPTRMISGRTARNTPVKACWTPGSVSGVTGERPRSIWYLAAGLPAGLTARETHG